MTKKNVNLKPIKVNKKAYNPIVKYRGKSYDSSQFQNRDLSWLDFNYRVLNEALDNRTPLLERLRFIDIFKSNTDEFFMKRIGSLLTKLESPEPVFPIDNTDLDILYQKLKEKIALQQYKLEEAFSTDILPLLYEEGIELLSWSDLNKSEKQKVSRHFIDNIFPILTPLAVDIGHPFPFLSNLSKSIAVCLRKPRSKKRYFARVKIPSDLPQWILVSSKEKEIKRFVNIDDVISKNLSRLFSGMTIESIMLFRITRNAVINEDDEEIDDLMEMVEEGLKVRKFAPIVRFEYEENADPWLVDYLIKELGLTEDLIHPTHSFLPYTYFSSVLSLKRTDLKYEPFIPKTHPALNSGDPNDVFKEIARKDILLHFPFDSYSHGVESLLKSAVDDPKVKAIKMTLYRTDEDGRLIDLLIQAAENKKQVACIVEITARFDEERNIKWAHTLEEVGIHVSYGLINSKTHSKMLLIIREENNKLKPYVNIGTGNYNSQTSKVYTDLSLFTNQKQICADVLRAFNYLTGRSLKVRFRQLLVAPFNMSENFLHLIENEERAAIQGKPASIIAKMNSLEDPDIIQALYKASQAGVKIDLLVRGFCSLIPQQPGFSKNINVYSIVGRLLEHSRIYYFQNQQSQFEEGLFFIGSADWMYRNLYDRIEVIAPILEKSLKKKLWNILETLLADNRHLWVLNKNGHYQQKRPRTKSKSINSQELFIDGIESLGKPPGRHKE